MSSDRDALVTRLQDRGYTPKVKDVTALLGLLGDEDEDLARDASRAVMRVDAAHAGRVAELVATAAREAVRPARGRLTRLAGDLAKSGEPTSPLVTWLLEAVRDADPKTRRAAARGLGKLTPSPEIERALLDAFDAFAADEDRRPIVEALGKVGGEAARAKLAGVSSEDRAVVRAKLVIDREAARGRPQEIATEAEHAGLVRFHVRRGLEPVLVEELSDPRARVVAPGIVESNRKGRFADALAVRTALEVALPLPPERVGEDGVAGAIARALVRPEALSLFRSLTRGEGPIRFRVAFRRGGHQRATAWKIAELVRGATDALVNDPTSSTWEVLVGESRDAVHLELLPRGYEDTRFAYRGHTVPASSHPTIAAALVRVGPRRDDDVMWDPFTGAGAELVERARIGKVARLVGTDLDEKAVLAARANLEAAGVTASVTTGDALHTSPAGVTAIVSNPPMGRRVQRGGHLPLLERFVRHAGEVLPPGGTLTWIVPEPDAIVNAARAARFTTERMLTVDMGGFAGELMVLRKA